MTFISDLADLFTDTATHAALTGRDEFGAPTYGSGTEYSGRLVKKHRLVRDKEGHEVVSTAQFWFQGTPSIDPDDKVTLSDGSAPPIAAVETFQDEVGTSHVTALFR